MNSIGIGVAENRYNIDLSQKYIRFQELYS